MGSGELHRHRAALARSRRRRRGGDRAAQGVGGAPRADALPARARPHARVPGSRAAAPEQSSRGPRPVAPRPRPRRALSCERSGRRGPGRAACLRRPSPPPRPAGRREPDADRTPRRRPRGRWAEQPRGRADDVRDTRHRRDPPRGHLPQARHLLALAVARGAERKSHGGSLMPSRAPRGSIAAMSTIEMTEGVASREGVVTLCDAFEATVAAHPDRLALRSPEGAETLTWLQYAERSRRIAAGLAALGLGRGDVLALMLTQRL